MRALLAVIFSLWLALLASEAHASYRVIVPQQFADFAANKDAYYDRRVHILIAGRGKDLGEQFMSAALVQADRIHAIFPNDVVVVFAIDTGRYNDKLGKDGPRLPPSPLIAQLGFRIIEDHDTLLFNRDRMLNALVKFTKIASLQIYSHSGIQPGLMIDGDLQNSTANAWRPLDAGLVDGVKTEDLYGHFTDDAFVYLYGCNGAYLMAPWFSQIWHLPVAASFSSTLIQTAMGASEAQNPSLPYIYAFDSGVGTLETARMKSDKIVYDRPDGYGKNYIAFPAFMFFCLGGIDQAKCDHAMASSILTTVSPVRRPGSGDARKYYLALTREWLCPTSALHTTAPRTAGQQYIEEECVAALEQVTSYLDSGAPIPENLARYMPVSVGERSLDCTKFPGTCFNPECITKKEYLGVEMPSKGIQKKLFVAVACGRYEVAATGLSADNIVGTRTVATVEGIRTGSTSFVDEYVRYYKAFQSIAGKVPATFYP